MLYSIHCEVFALLFFTFSALFSPLHLCGQQNDHKSDVVVYGGSIAAVTASIQVARMGLKVVLVVPEAHLGGMSVEGLGGTDIDNHNEFQNSLAVGGLALEFYQRVASEYNRGEEFRIAVRSRTKDPSLWTFESSVAEKVIREWVAEFNVPVFYQCRLKESPRAVEKRANRIFSISTEDGRVFKGKIFIDAGIEGDLLAASGISTVIGRESNARYGETLNGIRAVTDHAQFQVKVDPYRIKGDSSSGLIPTIQNESLGIAGEGDLRIQAYCFRMCLTKDFANQIPFTAPSDYDRNQYEIYERYEDVGGKLFTPSSRLPNGKTDLGAWHDLSHNLYGMNWEYPAGSYKKRKTILDFHRNYTQGLFYFLANDTAMSTVLRSEWRKWGLCRNEFVDNAGWPRMFYIRDARRMVSGYVITQHHGSRENPMVVDDPVAVAYWPMDIHSVRRIVKDGYAYNEGFVFAGNYWRPFGISYRALIPKSSECVNLLTPTAISASHIAYGAVRLEYNYMTLGQACGTAAVVAVRKNIRVQQVKYHDLRKQLLKDKQIIDAGVVGMPDML